MKEKVIGALLLAVFVLTLGLVTGCATDGDYHDQGQRPRGHDHGGHSH